MRFWVFPKMLHFVTSKKLIENSHFSTILIKTSEMPKLRISSF